MLTTVLLYGEAGRKFGKRWRFDISSPAEAVRALQANAAGFKEWLLSKKDNYFRVLVGDDNDGCNEEQLYHPNGGQTIRIIPLVQGAKEGGVGQMILGAVLVVVGVIINVVSKGTMSALGNTLINAGVAMIVGGIAQMLFAPPTPGKPDEKPGSDPSYLFSGPVNTTAQGQCIPVGYGKLRVGSAVIYGTIATEDYTSGGGFGGGGGGGGCPVLSTSILMADGSFKLAGELRTGDVIRTQHEDELNWVEAEINVLGHLNNKTHAVTLEDDRRVTVSSTHRFLRYRQDVDVYDFCPANELQPGDVIEGECPGVVRKSEYTGFNTVVNIQVPGARTYQTEGLTSHNIKHLEAIYE